MTNLAWHFLADHRGQPVTRDGQPVIVGQTIRVDHAGFVGIEAAEPDVGAQL